jgi:DNA-binding cell septation regulator SpoVG
MPSRSVGPSRYRDVAHPFDNAFRLRLEEAVLTRYHEVVGVAETEPVE